MRRSSVITVLFLTGLLASGCATQGRVNRMLEENNAVYNQRIGLIAVRVDDLAKTQQGQKENLLEYLKKQNRLLVAFIDQLEEKQPAGETVIATATPTY